MGLAYLNNGPSNARSRRNLGFWTFLASNVLWIAWGLHAQAWALIALQVCLAVLNVRGLFKTEGGGAADTAAASE